MLPGTACGAGLVCTDRAECSPGCWIDAKFFASGAVHPDDDCRFCDPAHRTDDWSVAADGVACDDGNGCSLRDACFEGSCVGVACELPTPLCDSAAGACVQCLGPQDCDDGVACNGAESCGPDHRCVPGTPPCAVGSMCQEVNRRCANTTTITLASIDDDGYEDPFNQGKVLGVGALPYSYMTLNSAQHVGGLRFAVPLPRGTVITSADLRVWANAGDRDSPFLSMDSDGAIDAAPLVVTAGNISGRTRAGVVRNVSGTDTLNGDPPNGGYVTIGGMRDLLQPKLDNAAWVEGNHVLFIFTGSTQNNLEWRQLEHSSGMYPPLLVVRWSQAF